MFCSIPCLICIRLNFVSSFLYETFPYERVTIEFYAYLFPRQPWWCSNHWWKIFRNFIAFIEQKLLGIFWNFVYLKLWGHVKHFSSNRIVWKLKHAKSFTLMNKLLVAPPQKMKRNRKEINFWNKKCFKKFVNSFCRDRNSCRKLLKLFIVVKLQGHVNHFSSNRIINKLQFNW